MAGVHYRPNVRGVDGQASPLPNQAVSTVQAEKFSRHKVDPSDAHVTAVPSSEIRPEAANRPKEGTSVDTDQRTTHNSRSPRSGAFVALVSWLPSLRSGRRGAAILALTSCASMALLVVMLPEIAQANFVRPPLRQILGPSAGPFSGPGGVAVDSGEDLWVGDGFRLDQFAPASLENNPLETVPLTAPEPPQENGEQYGLTSAQSLAIDHATGNFYLTADQSANARTPYVEVYSAAGVFVRRIGPFGLTSTTLALDNSSAPSAGDLYVATRSEGGGVVSRYAPSGLPQPFSAVAEYLAGNQIIGFPINTSFRRFDGNTPPRAVAVDSHADVYLTTNNYGEFGQEPAILEYAPSGLFLRAITGAATPGIAGSNELGGWGGNLFGLAVDPGSGDILVSVHSSSHERFGAIDEFNASGNFLGQITKSPTASTLHEVGALTADPAGDLYVVEDDGVSVLHPEHVVDVYGPGGFVPGLRIAAPTGRTQTTAVLNGAVNPEAALDTAEPSALTDCHFEYLTEAEFNAEGFSGPGLEVAPCESPDAGEVGDGNAFVAVHAAISRLLSGETYRYRLSATAEGVHSGGAAKSPSAAFTAPAAPRVGPTAASNISSTFADLTATIDPLGADTHYRFQYATRAQFEASGFAFALSTPEVDLGSGGATGDSSESVVAHVGGLSPSTAYTIRVLASNECRTAEACLTEGAVVSFKTAPLVPAGSAARIYELLTPPNKGSAEDLFSRPLQNEEFTNIDIGVSSESGDQFLFQTRSAFGNPAASGSNVYVFSRHPTGGWTETSLAAPDLGVQSLAEPVFDPADMSRVAFLDVIGSAPGPGGAHASVLLGAPGGPYTDLYTGPPTSEATVPSAEAQVVGGSADLSHVVLQSQNNELCPGPESLDPGTEALCQSIDGGALTPIDVTREGANRCGAVLGRGAFGVTGIVGGAHHAVSTNGSRIFFTSPEPAAINHGIGCWNGKAANAPQLYLRSGAETVEVSAPALGAPEEGGHHLATFVGAAADGSRVYFLSEAELTEDDAGIHDPELYEYDVESATLTRISHGDTGTAAADVFDVFQVQSDGSAVYFLANGVLASNTGPGGETASQGDCSVVLNSAARCNLYRYDVATGTTRYVATLSALDDVERGFSGPARSGLGVYGTPDGRFLLFTSIRALTGEVNNAGTKCHLFGAQGSSGPCPEVYRYDSAGNELVCVSCSPTGAPPTSGSLFNVSSRTSPDSGTVRAMSNDGSYVFFETANGLVPQDTNGLPDVYQWHEGTLSLISSGKDASPSYFLGASPDGSNVFFGTHARLVKADTDSSGDLYDARLCTAAEPCPETELSHSGVCEGDACSHPVPAPNDPTPASLGASGPGNPLYCPKGKVQKKGRCVAKKQQKHDRKKGKRKKSGKKARTRAHAGKKGGQK